MEQASTLASIGRLVTLTVFVGVGVGVITGLTLRLILGTDDRMLLAALTAAITGCVTTSVVSGVLRREPEPPAG